MAISLKKQVKKGLAWRGGADILQQVLQVVFTIVLARLLTKADFGLVAMALIVNRFAKVFIDLGFGAAIIHNQEITKNQISAIFIIQLLLNSILTVIIYLSASWSMTFFDEPKLYDIIQYMSFLVFFQSFQFPQILLQKQLDFKSVSLINIISSITSNGFAICFAFLGYGIWSLIIRLFVQNFISGILSFYFSKWCFFKPDFKNIKSIFVFGSHMFGMKFFKFFSNNIITILTGKYLGSDVLGLFNIAYNLAIEPATKMQNILSSVLTPGFSIIQNNFLKFKTNFIRVLDLSSFFFIPMIFVFASISNNLIDSLYGIKWTDAGDMLKLLAFVGLMRGTGSLLKSALLAKGYSSVLLKSTIIRSVFSIPLMFILMQYYSVYGLIIAFLFGALISFIYEILQFDSMLDEKNLVFKIIKIPTIIGIFLFSISSFLDLLIDINVVFQLTLQLLLSVIIFYFILLKYNRDLILMVKEKFSNLIKSTKSNL